MDATSGNGSPPPVGGQPSSANGSAGEGDAGGVVDAPGCWQLPGLVARLVLWLSLLVVVLWLLVAFVTSVGDDGRSAGGTQPAGPSAPSPERSDVRSSPTVSSVMAGEGK